MRWMRSIISGQLVTFSMVGLLFGHDGKIVERFGGAGVDEAVAVAFGAVVGHAGEEGFLAVVEEAAGAATENVDDFAGSVVEVVADGAAGFQGAQHYLVGAVEHHAGFRNALSPFEIGQKGQLNVIKIDNHFF